MALILIVNARTFDSRPSWRHAISRIHILKLGISIGDLATDVSGYPCGLVLLLLNDNVDRVVLQLLVTMLLTLTVTK